MEKIYSQCVRLNEGSVTDTREEDMLHFSPGRLRALTIEAVENFQLKIITLTRSDALSFH